MVNGFTALLNKDIKLLATREVDLDSYVVAVPDVNGYDEEEKVVDDEVIVLLRDLPSIRSFIVLYSRCKLLAL